MGITNNELPRAGVGGLLPIATDAEAAARLTEAKLLTPYGFRKAMEQHEAEEADPVPIEDFPFHFDETDTLLATSASSPLVLLASSRVGTGYKARVNEMYWRKPGNDAWLSAAISVQDTAGAIYATIPNAAILSAAYGTLATPATFGDALFDGGGDGKGIQVVASADEPAGDVEIRVVGTIAPV